MDDPLNARTAAIVAAIEDYLQRVPHALDSVRGVRDWWLPPDLRDCPQADLEEALRRLVDARKMVVRPIANGVLLFGKAPPSRRGNT